MKLHILVALLLAPALAACLAAPPATRSTPPPERGYDRFGKRKKPTIDS